METIDIKDVIAIEINPIRESASGESWREIIIKTPRGQVEILLRSEDLDSLKVFL